MSYSFSWLAADRIATDDTTFRIRSDHPPQLAASIRRAGIRTPLLVQPRADGRHRLISGWGRWQARPADQPLPCFLLPPSASVAQLWDIFLRDNDSWNVVEVARVLAALRALPGLTAEQIIRDRLPRLGLKPAKELYQRHLRLLELSPVVLDFIAAERLPLRRATLFLKLPSAAAETFAVAARRLRLSLNECAESLEWLADVSRREAVACDQLLAELLADEPELTRDGFRQRLRQRRYPQLHLHQQRLEALRRELRFNLPVAVEWDWRLETPGFQLRATVTDKDALKTLTEGLAANQQRLEEILAEL